MIPASGTASLHRTKKIILRLGFIEFITAGSIIAPKLKRDLKQNGGIEFGFVSMKMSRVRVLINSYSS